MTSSPMSRRVILAGTAAMVALPWLKLLPRPRPPVRPHIVLFRGQAGKGSPSCWSLCEVQPDGNLLELEEGTGAVPLRISAMLAPVRAPRGFLRGLLDPNQPTTSPGA